jgi:16S rRNA (adenine1518-N6/adenine1519-N6)-dimethyltransferase
MPDYDSPTALREFLEAEGLAMSKRFGQNFLVNRRQRERILEAALGMIGLDPAKPEDIKARKPAPAIWEIGPGIGSMTELCLEAGLGVRAFEIDHGFARVLTRLYGERANFSLIEGDFLKTWKAELAKSGAPALVFGNLPYNVANAIAAELMEGFTDIPLPPMAFTVQKEAAQRMAAKPGSKDYSAFTVLCSSTCKVKLAFDLSSSSFWPVPRVTSTLALLKPRPDPVGAEDRAAFSAFCRSSFSSRRKTIKNNLKAAGYAETAIAESIASLSLPPQVRAEVLDPSTLEKLWKLLRETPRGSSRTPEPEPQAD